MVRSFSLTIHSRQSCHRRRRRHHQYHHSFCQITTTTSIALHHCHVLPFTSINLCTLSEQQHPHLMISLRRRNDNDENQRQFPFFIHSFIHSFVLLIHPPLPSLYLIGCFFCFFLAPLLVCLSLIHAHIPLPFCFLPVITMRDCHTSRLIWFLRGFCCILLHYTCYLSAIHNYT